MVGKSNMNPPIPPPVPTEVYPVAPKSGGGKKWVLFGCGGCLGLIVLGGVAMAAIMYFAMGAIKKSDAFANAVKQAQESTEVQAALGNPIETGWMVQGSFNHDNGGGEANFTVPLKGPKGEATLQAVGEKAVGGAWIYSQLEAILTNGSKVNLLTEGNNVPSVETGAEPPAVEEEVTPEQ